MPDWMLALLARPIDGNTTGAVLGSLGVVSSVLTFIITSIVARPAMVRWRSTCWWLLVLWWTAVVLCLAELLLPDDEGHVRAIALKIGIGLWALGLIRLLILVRQVLYVHRSALSVFSQHIRLPPFRDALPGELGPPFLNQWAGTLDSMGKQLRFPLLLAADREAPGLEVAQGFIVAGLTRGGGAIYMTFTRPAATIARQILRRIPAAESHEQSLANRFRIIDCFSTLYFRDNIADDVPAGVSDPALQKLIDDITAQCTRRCDPRDPVALQSVYKDELRAMQRRGVEQVRVVYDSLSDFLSIADPELVVSYLRHMVVFDERLRILSLYLLWPEVLREPISDSYLSWFFTAVLRMRNEGGTVTAALENVSEIRGRVLIDPALDLADRGFEIDHAQVEVFAYAIRRLHYTAIEFADRGLFPQTSDRNVEAGFFFFLTAIDHRTATRGSKYEQEIDGTLRRGSDLMYAKAKQLLETEPDLFTAERLESVSEETVAEWFRAGSTVNIANPGLRAYLLRNSAQHLIERYDGSMLTLLAASDRWLDNVQCNGLLQRLAEFRAFEDPGRKKSHLLAKLLMRRGIWTPCDSDKQEVAVDPVLVQIGLRSGLISVTDADIVGCILSGRRLSQDVTTRLRMITLRAFKAVSNSAQLAAYELDDLLWGLGREVCRAGTVTTADALENTPYVQGIAHPEALADFIACLRGTPRDDAPLLGMDAVPNFPETWYF